MIFSSSSQPSALSVDAGHYDIYVARVSGTNGTGGNPTWGNWKKVLSLRFDGAFYGSSVVGGSYCKISVCNAPPLVTTQVDVENDASLNVGDRVAIVAVTGSAQNCIFQGYATAGHILIDAKAETLTFHVVGPEWLWGGSPTGGTCKPITGQTRRIVANDDLWCPNGGVTTPLSGLYTFTDERLIFNPTGRQNMSTPDEVVLGGKGQLGRCFEIPDRQYQGAARAAFWTVYEAARYLDLTWNDPDITGINNYNWPKDTIIDTTQSMGQVDVDGLGLWEALRKAIAPRYAFFVDPRPQNSGKLYPSPPSNDDWGPFNITLFERGTGDDASLYLNARGTSAANAIASVVRIPAAKSIEKVVNQAEVYARLYRHIKLQYWSGQTPTLTTPRKSSACKTGG